MANEDKDISAQHVEDTGLRSRSVDENINEKAVHERSAIYQACKDLDEEAVERLAPNGNIEFMFEKIDEMDDHEAVEILREAIIFHKDDWNFPADMMEKIKLLVQGPEAFGGDKLTYSLELRIEACLMKWASPYPEVRSIMDFEDDESLPYETIRAYVLGLIWSCIGAGVNTFFNSRFPGISISAAVVQILVYPCGMFLAFALPDWGFKLGKTRHSLNPGPYNFKEQMFVTVVFSAGMSSFQAYQMLMVQHMDVYYGREWAGKFGYQIMITLFFQFMGVGLVGVVRRLVVINPKAIWPGSLYSIAMNRALLSKERTDNIHGWTISRYRFFFVAFAGMFVYYWLPGYLFTALSTFNWLTWISPQNPDLAIITGSLNGLGINPWTTFDWNQMTAAFPSLTNPFFNLLHRFAGTFLGVFIIMGLYYTNFNWTSHLPINSPSLFTNNGTAYDVTQVTTPETGLLDESKYQKYSPPMLSAGKLVQAGASFVVYPLYFIYMVYDQWPMIRDGFRDLYLGLVRGKSMYGGKLDPHSRMMAKYKEVPDWWFFVVLIATIVLAIITLEVYPTDIPIWFLFVIIGLSIVFLPPLVILQATTGTNFGLLYLMIIVAGYCLPGNANAQMLASLLGGWSIDGTTDSYVSLQKVAHYSCVAPRAVFRGQMAAILATSFVAVGVEKWQMSNIPGLCTPDQPNKFTCAAGAVATYSSSVVYGLIGPKRIFAGLYPILKYCFLMGFLIGVVFCGCHWIGFHYGENIKAYCREKYSEKTNKYLHYFFFVPMHYFKWFNPVLVLVGMQDLCPINMSQCWPGFLLCFIFNYWIRNRWLAWWEKYNYVLAAAMYAGVAFSALIIYFAVQFHPKTLNWWGNTVSSAGLDGTGVQSIVPLPAKGYFGPDPGNFP